MVFLGVAKREVRAMVPMTRLTKRKREEGVNQLATRAEIEAGSAMDALVRVSRSFTYRLYGDVCNYIYNMK